MIKNENKTKRKKNALTLIISAMYNVLYKMIKIKNQTKIDSRREFLKKS